ncbi:MAG: hypothetical protein E7448_03915 [Ruminococcaceae bacterium]|nr:hypothetical protein [Oscillospiraceae bacterium]
MDREIVLTDAQEHAELELLNRKVSQRTADADRKKAAAVQRWENHVMQCARAESVRRQWSLEWQQIGKVAKLVAAAIVVHVGRVTGCIIPQFALLVQIGLLAGCFLHMGRFCEIRKQFS